MSISAGGNAVAECVRSKRTGENYIMQMKWKMRFSARQFPLDLRCSEFQALSVEK